MNRRKAAPPERRTLKNARLFSEELQEAAPDAMLPLSKIQPRKEQPRRYFDEAAHQKLVASVKKHGILQPLLVRKQGSYYELIAGERRYRAAVALGLKEAPVVIRDLDETAVMEIALVENLQREDLNSLEETEAILALLSLEFQCSTDEVIAMVQRAARQGKKNVDNVVHEKEKQQLQEIFEQIGRLSVESFRTHRLPLLKLPEDLLAVLREGKLHFTKVRAIAQVADPEIRGKVLEGAIAHQWSIREVKRQIADLMPKADERSPESQLRKTNQGLNRSKFWERDPKRWGKIAALLEKIEKISVTSE